MAAPRYSRSAFLSPRLAAARRWAAVTGAGLALPLLAVGAAAAACPDSAAAGTLDAQAVEQTVQQVLAQISTALPAAPVTPALPSPPQLPEPPQVPAPPAVPSPPPATGLPTPEEPTDSCPPSSEPTRATPTPSPSPSASAEPSGSAEPSASAPASPSPPPSPSASAAATPSPSPSAAAVAGRPPARPGGGIANRHQPAPATVLPEDSVPEEPAEQGDGWDGQVGGPIPGPAGSDELSPSAPAGTSAAAGRPQAAVQDRADAAVPLRWTDPSALQLPLGAGLTMIGLGLALVAFRLRGR